jgi:hypothetical protein
VVSEIYHMSIPAHAVHAVQVRLKSISNEGYFTLEAETVYRVCLPSNCSGVTEICDMALPAHVLQAVQVRLKSLSNEGYFTLDAETVFHSYPPSHCCGVIETLRSLRTRYVLCKLD